MTAGRNGASERLAAEPSTVPLDRLLRGSIPRSNAARLLSGRMVLQRRYAPAEERAEEVSDRHYLLFWERKPAIAERAYARGRFTRVAKLPGTVSMGSAGVMPAVRPITPYHVVACAIDPALVEAFAEENGLGVGRSFAEHLGVGDGALGRLASLIVGEAAAGNPNGALFGDHLAYAMISRFVALARTDAPALPRAHALPKPHLKRVLDMIEACCDRDLSVAALAETAGYSPSHFLRMFRAATGMTPHRYVMEVRLRKAVVLIREGRESILSIALASGFSSHAHLTRIFHDRFGVPPSACRRKIEALP